MRTHMKTEDRKREVEKESRKDRYREMMSYSIVSKVQESQSKENHLKIHQN
jgi:hypothetical protein